MEVYRVIKFSFIIVLLLSLQVKAAPFFISTGNPGIDGAIAGAGIGFFAGTFH